MVVSMMSINMPATNATATSHLYSILRLLKKKIMVVDEKAEPRGPPPSLIGYLSALAGWRRRARWTSSGTARGGSRRGRRGARHAEARTVAADFRWHGQGLVVRIQHRDRLGSGLGDVNRLTVLGGGCRCK